MFSHCLSSIPRQHQRQLDPTEIVMIPYDLTRLWLYVAGIGFVFVLTTATTASKNLMPQQQQKNNLPSLLAMTFATWLAYIVFGASPTENLWHTLAAALHLMLLIQWDVPLLINEEHRSPVVSSSLSVLERLSLACSSNSSSTSQSTHTSAVDRVAVVQTQAITFCTIILHILRLYDRGWQAQRWPIPTILGATVGWIVGLWLGLLGETFSGSRSLDKGNL